jgi:hypothetical protein
VNSLDTDAEAMGVNDWIQRVCILCHVKMCRMNTNNQQLVAILFDSNRRGGRCRSMAEPMRRRREECDCCCCCRRSNDTLVNSVLLVVVASAWGCIPASSAGSTDSTAADAGINKTSLVDDLELARSAVVAVVG